jgi:F0F1-type ATP synthase assembly protein I
MRSDHGGYLALLAVVGQVGLIMAGATAGGLLTGLYLDSRLGTGPVLTVSLLFAGVAGGMAAVYRLVMALVGGSPREDSRDGPAPH